MKIDVIIPNYKGFSLIEENLPKVLDVFSDYNNASLIIVDDGSGKDEISRLDKFIQEKQKKYKIKIIKNEKNLGFSSSINRGAFESDADLLVFLNTDVVPEKRFLDPVLKDFLENKNLFGIGCMDKSIEGNKIMLRGRGIGSWKRGFLVHSRGEVNKKDTFWIAGGSSIVRRELFIKLGGFDTIYDPFYWEDIDLSYRARKQGFEILFENKSVVIHKHMEGAIKKYFSGFKIKTIAYRNQFIFVWKNITDSDLIFAHIFWLPFHFAKAFIGLDAAFFYGFLAAFIRIPLILIKKRRNASSFVKKDKDVIK